MDVYVSELTTLFSFTVKLLIGPGKVHNYYIFIFLGRAPPPSKEKSETEIKTESQILPPSLK